MTTKNPRIVIIGAGINSLVAALVLARKGLVPVVFERGAAVGGVAVTEEFHPGFRASMVAPMAGPIAPAVLAALEAAGQRVDWLESPARLFLPETGNPALALWTDPGACAAAIEKIFPADAGRYRDLRAALAATRGFFRDLLVTTPPAVDDLRSAELLRAARLGFRLRRLGKRTMVRVLRWLPMPVADLAEEWFAAEPLRAAVAARGIFAATMGPRSPGTSARLLLQVAPWGEPFAPPVVPRGGMGALAAAVAGAARVAGAQIRTGAEVEKIVVKDGRVAGVALAGGEEIRCPVVVSGADPARTLVGLIDPGQLPPSVAHQVRHYRTAGSVARVHLALDALPRFRGATAPSSTAGAAAELAGRIQIGCSIEALEGAFDAAKYGAVSAEPFLEATIPTVLDPSLAPAGKHVLSVWMQFAPYRLREGNWSARAGSLLPLILATLEAYAPGISGLVLGSRVLTPADLEQTYALTGGHIFHGELAMDQMFALRPVFGMARYRGPLAGLYLCGAGTHPGIGVTGASGWNAAREILEDLRAG
ncbi:MAG TPA: NAD(P)/FAD-dependent oxidoreductase [Candidatus Acidoferrales bacterium]|nr:NAD(P)/FAD-dependent oxidoreductase [Candidatus Acidoferrales bacterium]